MPIAVDQHRLTRELDELAAISDAPAPAVTRIVFTETDRRARVFLRVLFAEAGLAVREDAVGNTFARWPGSEPDLPPVATGSHIDAIPNAGRYDGTVGVLGGLEAIRALACTGFRPRRSIELIVFTSEEPTRFGIGCLGSRLLAGVLDESAGERLKDGQGLTLDAVRAQAGFGGALSSVGRPAGTYSAFVELHIEQGPILERQSREVGIVTAIAAPASLAIEIEGEGGHAGAVLMPDRHDAFLAAAELALAIESAARSTESIDTVATVGVCRVFPGAVNSVPSRVQLEVDVRDIDRDRRDGVLARIEAACGDVAGRRGVRIRSETVNADSPASCDPTIVDVLTRACEARGLRGEPLISRAYHDSLFMARIAPTGMLFIPCRGGVSHRPDEFASPEAIAVGAAVLADSLAALSAT
jgi:N-carbamoyl-L-amino-acid hydrolase